MVDFENPTRSAVAAMQQEGERGVGLFRNVERISCRAARRDGTRCFGEEARGAAILFATPIAVFSPFLQAETFHAITRPPLNPLGPSRPFQTHRLR